MSSAAAQQPSAGMVITHPNREKAIVQSTRATVILLLLVSAALILLITIGGAEALARSSIAIQIFFVLVYLLLAFFAGRWNRGVLPVASGLGVLLIIFALTGGPAWFNRNGDGLHPADAERRAVGAIDAAARPPADPARDIRDARLPAGLERRGRAARRRRRGLRRSHTAPGLTHDRRLDYGAAAPHRP